MFETGMHHFRVRLTRDGEDVYTFFLFACDVDDAVARAKDTAAEAKEKGATDEDPFDNLEGLETWVQQLS